MNANTKTPATLDAILAAAAAMSDDSQRVFHVMLHAGPAMFHRREIALAGLADLNPDGTMSLRPGVAGIILGPGF